MGSVIQSILVITFTIFILIPKYADGQYPELKFKRQFHTSDCLEEFSVGSPSPTPPSPPPCTVFLKEDEEEDDDNEYECVGLSKLKVRVGFESVNIGILCLSPLYMEVGVRFEGGLPSSMDARIETKMNFTRTEIDPKINRYEVRIRPYSADRRAVRYSVTTKDPTNNTSGPETVILILYRAYSTNQNRVHWLPESNALADEAHRTIFANDECVLIPCIPFEDARKDDILYVQRGQSWVPLKPDGSGITFEPSSGYILNTTLFPNYKSKYGCWADNTSIVYHHNFEILEYISELEVIPPDESIFHYMLRTSSNSNVKLECTYLSPVRLQGTILFSNGTNLLVTESETLSRTLPVARYTARYINDDLEPLDSITMSCLAEGGSSLHTWNLTVYDIIVESDLVSRDIRIKVGIDDAFNCTSDNFDDVEMRSLDCDNLRQCQLVSSCIMNKASSDPCRHYTPVNTGKEMDHCWSNHPHKSCNGDSIGRSGVIFCSAGRGKHSFHQIRFQGVDDIQYYYGQEDIPDKAKIFIKTYFDPTITYLTSVTYYFYCEAIRFVTEGYLHVFLEFKNGTRTNFRDDIAQILNRDTFYFGEIVTDGLAIQFNNTEIAKLICRSPQLESVEWIEHALNVTIAESHPPNITTADKFEFKRGAKYQVITCEAEGNPRPRFKWTMENGDNITDPLWVEGNTTLRFPPFEDSMAGIYYCNTTNVMGNDWKAIQVSVAEDDLSSETAWAPIIGGITGISLLIIILLIAALIYARRPKDRLGDEDIDDFFNGSRAEGNDDSNNNKLTDHLPYMLEFEIPKSCLTICRTKPLGNGEYGEVYEGTALDTDGVPRQVAVKIPKRDCPLEIFKTLLSELKTMIFIGSHENVVGLVGAYTGEIRRGILHIAIEFCELGSLEGFLQKNSGKYGKTENCEEEGDIIIIIVYLV